MPYSIKGDLIVERDLQVCRKASISQGSTAINVSSALQLNSTHHSLVRLNVVTSNQNVTLPIDGDSIVSQIVIISVENTSTYSALIQTANTDLTSILTVAPGQSIWFIFNGLNWTKTKETQPDTQLNDVAVSTGVKVYNFEGNVAVVDEGSGKTTVTVGGTSNIVGQIFQYYFYAVSVSVNKWMSVDGSSSSSDVIPMVIPFACILDYVTLSNENTSVEIDIQIYKNTVLFATVEVRDKKYFYKTNISGTYSFAAGDRVGIYLASAGGTSPKGPVVEIGLRLTDSTRGTGGSN